MGDATHNLIIREWFNGGLVPLNLCLVVVTTMFLWDTLQAHGRGWTRQPGVSSACALWWIFAADAIRAVFVWVILRQQNRGLPIVDFAELANFGFMIAALISLAATLRCIFLFTPKAWGHWGWVGSALITCAFLGIARL
jgi:hypothetical protein